MTVNTVWHANIETRETLSRTVFLDSSLEYSWWIPLEENASNAGIRAEVSHNASAKTHPFVTSC
jgi:hypothetical protein